MAQVGTVTLKVAKNWRHSLFVRASESTVSGWKYSGMVMPKSGKPPTSEDWFALWIAQAGACGICAQPLNDWEQHRRAWRRTRQIVLDHDHDNGLVRGILCQSCNVRIERRETWLKGGISKAAQQYLENPPAQRGFTGFQLPLPLKNRR